MLKAGIALFVTLRWGSTVANANMFSGTRGHVTAQHGGMWPIGRRVHTAMTLAIHFFRIMIILVFN